MAKHRLALITGSGRQRIGNVIARDLAQAGYRIAIHYRHSKESAEQTAEDIRTAGGVAQAFQADLGREEEVKRLISDTLGAFERIDVLVCTSSIWQPKPLEETTLNDLELHWQVNARAVFLCCQHAGLAMTKQDEGGCIVTIGDWATRRPYQDYAAYFLSKGSIPTLTRTMAVELGNRNPRVRVNGILPVFTFLKDLLLPPNQIWTRVTWPSMPD